MLCALPYVPAGGDAVGAAGAVVSIVYAKLATGLTLPAASIGIALIVIERSTGMGREECVVNAFAAEPGVLGRGAFRRGAVGRVAYRRAGLGVGERDGLRAVVRAGARRGRGSGRR